MLHNDLSNKSAPILCFNFERVICDSFSHKKLFGYKYSLDFQHVKAINNLWNKDFHILYVTFVWPDKKIDSLENELDDLGCLYSGVVKFKDIASLKIFLRNNLGSAYYDTNEELVSNLYPYGYIWKDFLVQLWNK